MMTYPIKSKLVLIKRNVCIPFVLFEIFDGYPKAFL